MEQAYWFGRKRAAANARRPVLAPARPAAGGAYAGPAYYLRLEAGARWLAGRAASEIERHEHLGMANRYRRLGLDAAGAR